MGQFHICNCLLSSDGKQHINPEFDHSLCVCRLWKNKSSDVWDAYENTMHVGIWYTYILHICTQQSAAVQYGNRGGFRNTVHWQMQPYNWSWTHSMWLLYVSRISALRCSISWGIRKWQHWNSMLSIILEMRITIPHNYEYTMNILNARCLLPWSIHSNTTDRNCRSNCIDEKQTSRYLASFFLSLESQFIHLKSKFGIQCEWKM